MRHCVPHGSTVGFRRLPWRESSWRLSRLPALPIRHRNFARPFPRKPLFIRTRLTKQRRKNSDGCGKAANSTARHRRAPFLACHLLPDQRTLTERLVVAGSSFASWGSFRVPIFEYHCSRCDSEFELLVSDREQPPCPDCGETDLEKLISAPSAHTSSGGGLSISAACPPSDAPPCRPGCCRLP
jgi:putative FmdB family regulatory protein